MQIAVDVGFLIQTSVFSSEKVEVGSIKSMGGQDDLGRRQIGSLSPGLSQLGRSWVFFVHHL